MKTRPLPFIILLLSIVTVEMLSCKAIIEPSINKQNVFLLAPGDQSKTASYTVNFWWEPLEDALTYNLQVVTPGFNNIGSLVLDTIVKSNKFTINLKPGDYQWRVQAQNGSSQTKYSDPKSFTILLSSIKGQSVQLISPASNTLSNQSTTALSWGSLYGATRYRLQIDTNSFVSDSTVIYDQAIPGQQFTFRFPKEQVYQWRVRAENDTVKADWSSVNTITYDHTPPGPVTVISPANDQQVTLPVSLQWNAVATASKYRLYVFKADSTTNYNTTFPVLLTNTSYSFTSGTLGERIYWKVTAIDAAGNEGQASRLRNFVLR